MARIILVRHGQAAASWDADTDPGLDDIGRTQAATMADALKPHGPLPLVTSPLRRTRETAAAIEAAWNTTARVEPTVGEIPSPTDDLHERGQWLRSVMRGTWSAMDNEWQQWRANVVATLQGITTDTVIVTHFIAINAAVGDATDDDRLVCFTPDYCSCTTLIVDEDSRLIVEHLGAQAATIVF